jgi:hypothetical protein
MKRVLVELTVEEEGRQSPLRFDVKTLACAMFCSRDADPVAVAAEWTAALPEAVRQLDLPRVPKKLPCFCKLSRYLLTTDEQITVQGTRTCGEVEVVALVNGNEMFVGVGSDHCDRAIEPYSYYKGKQMCSHVLGPRVWRYEDVADHWDQLVVAASAVVDGQRVPFQEGVLGSLVPLPELLTESGFDRDGLVLFCGTVALAEYAYGEQFSFELRDPVLGRALSHAYSIDALNDMI